MKAAFRKLNVHTFTIQINKVTYIPCCCWNKNPCVVSILSVFPVVFYLWFKYQTRKAPTSTSRSAGSRRIKTNTPKQKLHSGATLSFENQKNFCNKMRLSQTLFFRRRWICPRGRGYFSQMYSLEKFCKFCLVKFHRKAWKREPGMLRAPSLLWLSFLCE